MKRWMRGGALLVAAAAVLALPCVAGAEDGSVTNDEIKWGKVFDLAACALSIATIETGLGATAAVITCGKAISEWWTE
jgi:hypothetical protein